MEIECIMCGNSTNLPRDSDTNRYDGQVFCQKCNLLIHIKLAESKIVEYKFLDKLPKKPITPITPELLEAAQKELKQSEQNTQELIEKYGVKKQS